MKSYNLKIKNCTSFRESQPLIIKLSIPAPCSNSDRPLYIVSIVKCNLYCLAVFFMRICIHTEEDQKICAERHKVS